MFVFPLTARRLLLCCSELEDELVERIRCAVSLPVQISVKVPPSPLRPCLHVPGPLLHQSPSVVTLGTSHTTVLHIV